MKRILAVMLLIFLLSIPTQSYAAESNEEYEQIATEIAEEYGICPELIHSIMFYESSFKADAKSSAGCIGLMQIHPSSHKARMKRLNVDDLTDPRQNILVGCDYLSELFKEYDDVAIVLDAYAGNLQPISKYEQGFVSKHAAKVLKRSERLEREHGK